MLDPQVSDVQFSEHLSGNTGFAFDLYREIAGKSDDNTFYSPYSISTAMVMTWAGALGDTASQMVVKIYLLREYIINRL
ncbi:MAG: hypothetical protein JXR95_01865 [Deltaproteobacteria bacterium]|nr:hypothetical protein [Deltaproteobacteria bacterium]